MLECVYVARAVIDFAHFSLSGRSRKSSLTGNSPDPYGGAPSSGFGRVGPLTPGSGGGAAAAGTHRSRPRPGVTHSQPGSRSTSPSSLRSYQTYQHQQQHHADTVGRRPRISLRA